jgi:hypothetical protein
MAQRGLHAALREAGVVGDGLMADADALRSLAVRQRPEMDIDDERGRRLVVADEIAEERLEDVTVEAKRFGCYGDENYSFNSHR